MNQQFYGIKYPFSEESDSLTFFDLNETEDDRVRSIILHIIFTPKGQRLRNPNFGTDLIKFIFEPNDNYTWESVKEEIQKQISFYLPQVKFNNINVVPSEEDDREVFVELDYTVISEGTEKQNKVLVKV
jgi:phage baseplate assembly protein W